MCDFMTGLERLKVCWAHANCEGQCRARILAKPYMLLDAYVKLTIVEGSVLLSASQLLVVASRVGVYIRLPGVDVNAFSESMQAGGGLLGYIDQLSGGSISKVGIFSLGVHSARPAPHMLAIPACSPLAPCATTDGIRFAWTGRGC